MNKQKLVFATNNPHKLEEARRIISDSFEIVSLAELGCHDDIPETADTLEGNALIKARWVRDRYGCDCFADDTGLMVDALDGAPGVYSARYAGEHCSPADNVAKLLREMDGVADRRAHFATTVALVRADGEHCFEGRVEGHIADHPHGDGGFGYDPVFVAEESGRCFAEMTADEKNAISHRGRAMRKLRDFLGMVTALVIIAVVSLSTSAQQWRVHPSYDGQMERIIDTPDFTYFLGMSQRYDPVGAPMTTPYGVLFRYDKEGEELMSLTSSNMLSDNMIRAVTYNYTAKYLAVAYQSGNIDLVYDNGDVVNIPGLRLSDSSYSRNINHLTVDESTNRVYAATDFGYLVIDGDKGEILSSRSFNKKLTTAGMFDGKFWVTTSDGLYYGTGKEFALDEMTKFESLSHTDRMEVLGDQALVINHGRRGSMAASRIMPTKNGKYERKTVWDGNQHAIERTRAGVMVTGDNTIRLYGLDGSEEVYDMADGDEGSITGSYNGRDFWFSTGRQGLARKKLDTASSRWTVTGDYFFPNASSAFFCTSMAYSPKYGMLVRNHGQDLLFNTPNGNFESTEDLISGYQDMTWSRYSSAYRYPSKGLAFHNPMGLAIDPNNPDHAYCGSTTNGLLRLDLSDASKSIHMSKPGDWLGGYGEPGFVAIVDDVPETYPWAARCLFAPPMFDNSGTLWTSYVNPMEGVNEGSKDTELWYWPASDRAASTSASNVRGWRQIRLEGLQMSNSPTLLPLRYSSNKNIIIVMSNLANDGLTIFDHNGTPDNTSDDRYVHVSRVIDQDGGEVPFTRTVCVLEDPETGLVWVSTSTSLFTFDPKSLLSGSNSVRRIKVPRNDGTNLADYLLEGVRVNDMIIDSRGRKWFATYSGGLVCTGSDGREILATYTSENSGIPGDIVYTVRENPDNNSLMLSTDKGLCEMFTGNISGGGSDNDVRVYPNPVKLDYYGYVTIDGLPNNAMVKIVDAGGALVRECGQESGGEVQWDLTDNNHRRINGGVYFIIATNGPNSDSYAKVGKVLVID